MPTPPKPYAVLKAEGKSHKTKAELEKRMRGEAALLTGEAMREWPCTKADPTAHRHFGRIRKLLGAIGKDDALIEAGINRYCVMLSEAADLEKERRSIAARQQMIDGLLRDGCINNQAYCTEAKELVGQKLALEKALSVKRKMLMDMEKENVMTIAAGLRSIPKAPLDEEDEDRMSEMLNRRMNLVQP